MKNFLILVIGIFGLFSFSSPAYATTLFSDNFDSYNLGNLTGQGGWEVASPSGNTKFTLVSGYVFSAPRGLQTSRATNQQLPIAIEKDLGGIPAIDLVNLAFNWRIHSTNYDQRITVVDSNNFPICGFGQTSAAQAYLDIPYSTLNEDYGWSTGDGVSYGSGLTTAVWYYPIIRMDFSGRTCSLSLDNGMSWSPSNLQLYNAAATGSATLDRIVITYPETSISPSYGAILWEIDGITMWSGGVASPPSVGEIDLSAFSATDSGYLKFDLSGNVGYVSGNLTTCEVDVYQQDINNNSPLFYNAGAGFEGTVVLWNTNLVDYTQIFPNNVYIGHGYSEISDAWQVESFKVHRFQGQNTALKFDYTCYENYGTGNDVQVYHSQGVNSAKPDFDGGLVASPAGLLNETPDGEVCGENDWFCIFKDWIVETISYFFIPRQTVQMTSTFAHEVEERAPFAYMSAISNFSLFNFEDVPASGGAVPIIDVFINESLIDKGGIYENIPPIHFAPTIPLAANPLFNLVRNFTTLLFWAVFIGFTIQMVGLFAGAGSVGGGKK